MSGRLFQLIDFLKQVGRPLTASEIKEQSHIDIMSNAQFYNLACNNQKIDVQDGLFQYKPLFNLRTKQDVSAMIREHWYSGHGGIHVRELRECWKSISKYVDELIASNEIIVFRQKDGKPLILFHNDMLHFDARPYAEFRSLWSQFIIPQESDLQRELQSAGLSVLQVIDERPKTDGDDGKKKKRKSR
jgi:hypothetical protein